MQPQPGAHSRSGPIHPARGVLVKNPGPDRPDRGAQIIQPDPSETAGDLFIVLTIAEAEEIISAARAEGQGAAVIDTLARLIDRATRTSPPLGGVL